MLTASFILFATTARAQSCSQSRCRSSDGQGGHDCWAGNGDPYACTSGQARLTGETTPYAGKTYDDYTCCDAACSDSRCRSSDGRGGHDCWAGNGDPFACSSGGAQPTGETSQYAGQTYHKYTCCDADCSDSRCRSPDGRGGHDCWAGNGEPFSCSSGYAQLSGETTRGGGLTWSKYSCCVNGPPSNDAAADTAAGSAIGPILVGVAAVLVIGVLIGVSIAKANKKKAPRPAPAQPALPGQPGQPSQPFAQLQQPVVAQCVTPVEVGMQIAQPMAAVAVPQVVIQQPKVAQPAVMAEGIMGPCGTINAPGARFCGGCGSPLA